MPPRSTTCLHDGHEIDARVLDLYHRIWDGQPLGANEYVLSADEKTQLQIRRRRHPTSAPAPGRPLRVEHEYRRHGTCAYQAASGATLRSGHRSLDSSNL